MLLLALLMLVVVLMWLLSWLSVGGVTFVIVMVVVVGVVVIGVVVVTNASLTETVLVVVVVVTVTLVGPLVAHDVAATMPLASFHKSRHGNTRLAMSNAPRSTENIICLVS